MNKKKFIKKWLKKNEEVDSLALDEIREMAEYINFEDGFVEDEENEEQIEEVLYYIEEFEKGYL